MLTTVLIVLIGVATAAENSMTVGYPVDETPIRARTSDLSLLDEGRLAMMTGRHGDAVELLLAALKEDTSDPQPLLLLGDLARQTGQLEVAQDYYKLALQLEPALVDVAVWMSRSLYDSGQEAEALKTLNSALSTKPDNLSLLLSKSHLLLEQHDLEDALATLQDAVEVDPNSFDVQRLLGLARLELQQWPEAETAYLAALSIRDDLQVHMELARVYEVSGAAPDRALDHLQYVLEHDRKNVPALTTAAELLLEQGSPGAARNLWVAALRLDSSYCPALNNSGRYAAEEGNLERAITTYNQCLANQPDFLPALLNRGLAYRKLGQCGDAHRDLDPLIETGGDLGTLATELLGECS